MFHYEIGTNLRYFNIKRTIKHRYINRSFLNKKILLEQLNCQLPICFDCPEHILTVNSAIYILVLTLYF